MQAGNVPQGQAGGETLPPEAYSGAAGMAACPTGCCPAGGPWSPPGIRQPWPEDEYLCDGGDGGKPVGINAKKEILGLKAEDTVAHFDTLDGRDDRRTEQRSVPLQPAIRRGAPGRQPHG